MITTVKALHPHPSLPQYRKQAKRLLKDWKSADPEASPRIRQFHPRMRGEGAGNSGAFGLADAQLTIAREHGFESWPKFAKHVEAMARASSSVSKFELAADSIASGNADALERLLRENPALIHTRSTRAHRATLLHYVGANGVEDYRQKTPRNAVAILKILLRAGAGVDARADMYGRDTTLGLVATSVHPLLAGVQQELMEILMEAGAATDAAMVNACLHNGRGQAAEFLAGRVAQLDLESAAGVGRLDVVQTCFDEHGALVRDATPKQMQWGLNWAAEYGRIDVIAFLVDKGADPAARTPSGRLPCTGPRSAPGWRPSAFS